MSGSAGCGARYRAGELGLQVTGAKRNRDTTGGPAAIGPARELPPTAANYLPVPPRSIDNGPSTPPPSEDHFWVPGNWEYVDGDYRWRSGYWSVSQGDWVWQPACYVYTPQGYLSVDGYWDYLPPDRGQLYAPVTFYNPVYLQPNYVYRPRYPLANAASLLLSLFIRPGYPHYYYGNFYGSSYASLGYRPWYDVGFGFGYVTPWFNNYDRLYRRSGIDFVGSMRRYENHSHADWKPTTTRSSPAASDPSLSMRSGFRPSHEAVNDPVARWTRSSEVMSVASQSIQAENDPRAIRVGISRFPRPASHDRLDTPALRVVSAI